MKATAYKHGPKPNPNTGAGYGIKINKADRDKYFDKNKQKVIIHLADGPALECTLAPSFWNNCTEIRDQVIGKWIWDGVRASGNDWLPGHPPKFNLEPISKTEFKLSQI